MTAMETSTMDRTERAIDARETAAPPRASRVASNGRGVRRREKTVERNDSMVMDETMRTEGLTRRDSYRRRAGRRRRRADDMARERGGANASTSDADAGEESVEDRKRRLKDEDMLIARAKAIREKIKALDARANVKTHDDSQRKSHWEYVMMEMTWLARDFASERDWKQETSRQVSQLVAACEGEPADREKSEEKRRQTRCATIAAEVAAFWAEAWTRAKERPLPNAAELVDDDDDEGSAGSDGEDVKTEATENDEEGEEGDEENGANKASKMELSTPIGNQQPHIAMLATTPTPPPGMKIINSWASNQLYLTMVEMKRDLVRDAIEAQEQKEQKERAKEAKKAAKKQKASKPTRGRGAKKKDEQDDGEDDAEDGASKADRIAFAESMEMDGMDIDMGLMAPQTPPIVEDFAAITYDAVPALNERVYRETMQVEAQKFAEYERSLRGWEENERKRARALVEAARYKAEDEAHRATMDERRTFLNAAAARGFYFDEEGYMVDIKGRRRKNRRGEYIQFGAPGHEVDMDFGVPIPKRAGPSLEEKRRSKEAKKKRRAGAMRSWTPMEDQLLCAIVHEFGCNWSLITDAFAAGTPIKGTYHRIEHCRWRFSHLTQIAEQEQNQQAIAALNLNKGSARTLMARALPVEDETVRFHFDRSCAVMAKHHQKIRRTAAQERVGMDKSRRIAPHRSWREVRNFCGPVLSPVKLADQALSALASNGTLPGNGNVMGSGGHRLASISPMGNVIQPGRGMPASAAAGLNRTGSGGMPMSAMTKSPQGRKKDTKTMAQFQQIGSYSPAAGATAMQLGGIAGAMPATGSKSPALAPGSYSLSAGKTPPTRKTTSMKRKGKKK